MKKDRLKELSADQLHELALTMNDFMKRTSCEIAIASDYSQREPRKNY